MDQSDDATARGTISIASMYSEVSTEGKERVIGHVEGVAPGLGDADKVSVNLLSKRGKSCFYVRS